MLHKCQRGLLAWASSFWTVSTRLGGLEAGTEHRLAAQGSPNAMLKEFLTSGLSVSAANVCTNPIGEDLLPTCFRPSDSGQGPCTLCQHAARFQPC